MFEWNINNQEFDYHPKHADMKLSPIVRSCYFLILCATSDKAFEVVKATSIVFLAGVEGRSMQLHECFYASWTVACDLSRTSNYLFRLSFTDWTVMIAKQDNRFGLSRH